jgi:hypothetical protein
MEGKVTISPLRPNKLKIAVIRTTNDLFACPVREPIPETLFCTDGNLPKRKKKPLCPVREHLEAPSLKRKDRLTRRMRAEYGCLWYRQKKLIVNVKLYLAIEPRLTQLNTKLSCLSLDLLAHWRREKGEMQY